MKHSLILLFIIALPLSAQIYGNADVGRNLDAEWYFTNINVGGVFDIWEIENDMYAGVKTFFTIKDFPWPDSMLRSIYTIGYQLNYSIFYFSIHYYCSHPTISRWYTQKRLHKELWDASGTEMKIGIRW